MRRNKSTPMWPDSWDHRILGTYLHIAAGHIIRFGEHGRRFWWVDCPHVIADDQVVARCLTLRDVVDDLTIHLARCHLPGDD